METQRIFGIAAAVLTTSVAHADLVMLSGVDKRHYQTGALKLTFDSGELEVFVRDGITILAPCAYDPLVNFLPPVLGCPLGTTGFIAAGDVDRDGIRDDNSYWSVASVVPAFFIEPSRPELPELFAGPPSKLPRPLSNFRDDSAITFYNIMEPATFRAYDQTRYEMIRRYGPIRQVETAVAQGTVTDPDSGDTDRDQDTPDVPSPAMGAIRVTVTGADIVGSPLVIDVPVVGPELGETPDDDIPGDGPSVWAAKVRIALTNTPAISDFYGVGGEDNAIVLTERNPDGNDATLNIALAAAPGTLLNAAPSGTSTNTTLGSVAGGSAAQALKQMDEELVIGQYIFTFPRLGNPEGIPVAIPVTISPNLEAVNPANRNRRIGFRFTSGLWDGEYYQMDPRLATKVTWTGNDRTVIRPGDTIHLSILNPAEDFLTFPPTIPQAPILLSPTVQQYQIPPFFYEIGEEGVLRLTFDRFLATSGVSFDTSQRDFRAKIRMVDSYAGYAAITLPLGTSRRELSATGDFDRDGVNNVTEFAFEFPTFESINAAARDQFVPLPTGIIDFGDIFGDVIQPVVQEFSHVLFDVDDAILDPDQQPDQPDPPVLDVDGHVVFSVPTRPQTGTTLRYTLGVLTPGKKKPKPVRTAGVWEVTRSQEQVTVEAVVMVDLVGAITGDAYANDQPRRTGPAPEFEPLADPIVVTRDVIQFRSLAPWPVGEPLPDFRVIVNAVPLR